MRHVIAVLEHDREQQVTAAADALAHLLGVDTRSLRVPGGEDADARSTVLKRLSVADVAGVALSAHGPDPVCWDVITRVEVPLIVVPRASERSLGVISRVVLPLDGSIETAMGVADVTNRAIAAGASVTAVHVFDAATAPPFWDQAAHVHPLWTQDFLRRNLPGAVELDLRSGRPAEEVLAEAEQRGADLIIIAWGRDLSTGRAGTVRYALTHGVVPVLLVASGAGPFPEHQGPFARPLAPSPG